MHLQNTGNAQFSSYFLFPQKNEYFKIFICFSNLSVVLKHTSCRRRRFKLRLAQGGTITASGPERKVWPQRKRMQLKLQLRCHVRFEDAFLYFGILQYNETLLLFITRKINVICYFSAWPFNNCINNFVCYKAK